MIRHVPLRVVEDNQQHQAQFETQETHDGDFEALYYHAWWGQEHGLLLPFSSAATFVFQYRKNFEKHGHKCCYPFHLLPQACTESELFSLSNRVAFPKLSYAS